MFALLAVILAWFFRGTYAPGHVAFSNDGPLGRLMSESHRLPTAFTGVWQDLNSVGYREGGALPSITFGLRWLLGPLLFAKLYPIFALLVLGMGAWCFFRQLDLAPLACLLGAIAATLNSSFFSAACWGVGSHAITIGMSFFALAALANPAAQPRWLRLALAGLALGMGISEGADIGAIFSLYVAAFVMYQSWVASGPLARKLTVGVGRVFLIAVTAFLLAAQPIAVLVETQINGLSGAQQTASTGEDRWDWATKWSLPKREALGLLIPGLFGYRVDTPQGGQYWGAAGRDAVWQRYLDGGSVGDPPKGIIRFTGGGNYTGVLVVLIACWAACQSFRAQNSVFSTSKRRWIWFWTGQAIVSLLLAFGKFAPFYRLLYGLPLASTIRNPAKFIHPVNCALVVLFAYGVHGLCKCFIEKPETDSLPVSERLRAWWQGIHDFDRTWILGCIAAVAVSFAAWFAYAGNAEALQSYLRQNRFDSSAAQAIAHFSVGEVGLFAVVFCLAVFSLFLVLSGTLRGKRAGWAGIILGLFLITDFGRANKPWMIAWDYKDKYATNPIIDTLRKDPNQHRVAILPFLSGPQDALFDRLYHVEWAQHQFQFYNVQSLDLVQMSRVPEDLAAFDHALQFEWTSNTVYRLTRRWQLTNTRYLLGAAALFNVLNQEIDPVRRRFEMIARFNVVPKVAGAQPEQSEEFTAVPASDGQYALFEFKGTLPRTKLYTQREVETNAVAALEKAADPAFDPETQVLVSNMVPTPQSGTTSQSGGTVRFEAYSPKDIVLRTEATEPSILLLNDRFDPNWKVLIDGQKTSVLRCNYLMRGVYLQPGVHQVKFMFGPPITPLYISLAAITAGILLLVLLCVSKAQEQTAAPVRLAGLAGRAMAKNAQLWPT